MFSLFVWGESCCAWGLQVTFQIRPNKRTSLFQKKCEKRQCQMHLKKKKNFKGKMLMRNAVYCIFDPLSLFFWPLHSQIFLFYPWKLKTKQIQVNKWVKTFLKKIRRKANYKSNARDLLRQTCFFFYLALLPFRWLHIKL